MRIARIPPILLALIAFTASAAEPSRQQGPRHAADYREARAVFWDQLYAKNARTLYCGTPTMRDGAKRRTINVEHVFPMGWVTKALQCGKRRECRKNSERFNHIEADLHNLYPARADVNKARRSMSFGIVKRPSQVFRMCGFKINKARYVAEPRRAARGRVARAMFYMSAQYDLPIYPRHGQVLLRWHRKFPPGANEHRRNDAIEALQGNRNPFVDDPQRAAQLSFSRE